MGGEKISETFAVDLLRALHDLDQHIGQLDTLSSNLPPDQKEAFIQFEGKILEHILFRLMAPIYKEHPRLGSPSEPGSWLTGA